MVALAELPRRGGPWPYNLRVHTGPPIEVEWQFDAPDLDAVTAWLGSAAVPGYHVRPKNERRLRDRYFDTPDWRIHRAGYTARLREGAERSVVTMKSMASAQAGIRRRVEYEEALPPGASPADAAAAQGPCGERLRLLGGVGSYIDLFSVSTNRRTFAVADDLGAVAEVAVDLTHCLAPGASEDEGRALHRIEVELEPGVDPARARRFVDLLAVVGRLTPATHSKFETGMLAAGLSGPPPFALGSTVVSRNLTTAESAYAILRKHFAVLLANEAGTRLGEDIEALHDMRVAARRLRAAMAAFAPYLSPALLRFREPLGWVGAVLGEVRDLDVHLEEFAAYHAHVEPEVAAGLEEIEMVLREDRVRARARMLRALDSARYQRLVEAFAAALRRGAPASHAPGHVPVPLAGPRLLRRRYRAIRRQGDAITPSSLPAEYHALRITAKKLRYALEFLAPLYGPPAAAFSTRVTGLQDLLGRHQDLEVAAQTLREVAARRGRRLSPRALVAVGILAERNRHEGAVLRREFPAVYRQLRGAPWRAVEKACAEATAALSSWS